MAVLALHLPSSVPLDTRFFMPDLLANLNPEQYAAVTLPNEPALILAGAGSGKTRVLITRIAWLIQQGFASPPTVLAVTFTNKAAREMLSRLSAMMPIDTRGMWIGTFHGLCNRMLRAHYRDAGLPQTFQILDTADQLSAIKRLMKASNIDDEKYPPKNVQYFINNAKEQGLRPDKVDATDNFNRMFVELYQAYDQQCQREGVVDFPELLLRCYELLSLNAPLRARITRRASGTSWSTSSRIRTSCSTPGSSCWRAARTRSSRWATTTSRSTPFAARTSATCATSRTSSGCAT